MYESCIFFLIKSLLNSLDYCSCFLILGFGQEAFGILAPQLGFETLPRAPPQPAPLEGELPTTGPPGKSMYESSLPESSLPTLFILALLTGI